MQILCCLLLYLHLPLIVIGTYELNLRSTASSGDILDAQASKLKELFETFHNENSLSSKELILKNSDQHFEDRLKQYSDETKKNFTEGLPSSANIAFDEKKFYNSDKSFTKSCGNVISLRNKGSVFLSLPGLTAIDLDFNFSIATEQNIANAIIYAPLPADLNRWSARYSASSFRFSVYEIEDKESVRELLEKCLQRSIPANSVPNIAGDDKVTSCLRHGLGAAAASRYVTQGSDGVTSQRIDSLDITTFWKKRRSSLSRVPDVTSKLMLLVSELKNSGFSHVLDDQEQCVDIPAINLILLAQDRSCRSHETPVISKQEEVLTFSDEANSGGVNTDLKRGLLSRKSRSVKSAVCQKLPMQVNFEDLGWSNWVIAPRLFQAYRCAGECPYPLGGALNATNYALLLTMMNSVDPSNSPTPCCAPTKLTPLSLLYLDSSDNVVLQSYENMIVESCGCR